MSRPLTPMLAQYLDIKARYPGTLLLFRMGDFYETFFEDAEVLARTAGVTLTSRDSKSDAPVPLAGVPYHAIDTYLARLLEAGLTVAICEQVEDPALAKGLVKREVVEVLSPGTAATPDVLAGKAARFCLAYAPAADGEREAGWALLDATTGEFRCGQEDVTLPALCERHRVREVIVREGLPGPALAAWRAALPQIVVNTASDAWFHPAMARRVLQEHFQVTSLTAFGLEPAGRERAAIAAGALLRYLTSLNLRRPAQVTTLRFHARGDRLLLDEETLRNLEVFRTLRGERGEGTLVHHVDRTVTAPGRRLLEQHLAEPFTDLATIALWHQGVGGLVTARDWRQQLRVVLRRVGDLERLGARAASGRLGPAQLRQLGLSLAACGELVAAARGDGRAAHPVCDWAGEIPDLGDVSRAILATLPDDPPANTRQGGCIRAGIHAELDHCRAVASDAKGYLAGLQQAEREHSGISSLKVGYNKVFGYYFDVTNKHLDKVPPHFEQKQTLVGSCRFVTAELKQAEETILTAEERAEQLEAEIYADLLGRVVACLAEVYRAAQRVAAIDLLAAFAELAEVERYGCPECDDGLDLDLGDGRHPVVEQLLAGDFIPNDTRLDGGEHQIVLLTGPNMGGKSTYLRQVALLVLLAQAGSWVPAARARIGVADRIFTRVGASDNVARGESTFFTEMSETAHILHQMSRRSLVILDEIGRGTSTYDGLSLAWAITEFLAEPRGPRPRTIFATHYHELTGLADEIAGLQNLRLEVREWEGKIVFLHRVVAGRSDKSYGIHVARLAGIPEPVLRRAEAILAFLATEDRRSAVAVTGGAAVAADRDLAREVAAGLTGQQLSLFNEQERDALEALRSLDLERISPVDAFMWLARLKRQLGHS